MTQPRLPLELLHHIIHFDFLSKADQCALALTAHLLRDESQRALFRTVGPLAIGAYRGPKAIRAKLFFGAVISSPHRLALMVHSYAQTTCWSGPSELDSGDVEMHLQQCREIYGMMASSLKLMTNLKLFSSREEAIGSSELYQPGSITQCLVRNTFALEALVWRHSGDEKLQLFEEFLPHQPTLKSLHLSEGIGHIHDDNAVERLLLAGSNIARRCLRLKSLSASPLMTDVVLSGGVKLTFLRWEPVLHPPYQGATTAPLDIQRQARHALLTVQYLQFSCDYSRGNPLAHIAPYLASLVVLTIPNSHIANVRYSI